MSTGLPLRTLVRSVSFMAASIQTFLSDTMPTALVVLKADIAEITSVPGCSESTSLTMPSNGARTVV